MLEMRDRARQTEMHTRTHTHRQTHTCTHARTHIHTHKGGERHTHTHTWTRACTRARACVCICACVWVGAGGFFSASLLQRGDFLRARGDFLRRDYLLGGFSPTPTFLFLRIFDSVAGGICCSSAIAFFSL